MASNDGIDFDGVRRAHVLDALETSRVRDDQVDGPVLVYLGRPYSAREVMTEAARRVLVNGPGKAGRILRTGKSTDAAMTQRLRREGFTVIPPGDRHAPALRPVLLEILDLQREWTSTNTPAMERRGVLVRTALPQIIRVHADLLEPVFTKAGYSMEVEGRDGAGRKVVSAWMRVYDDAMSPSATSGWYIVLHFERSGEAMYVTLGCGATKFFRGEFVPVPAPQLAAQVAWARGVAASRGFPVALFSDAIKLQGNVMSSQFEGATAFATRIPREEIDDARFWGAMRQLAGLLVSIYEEERKGRAPLSEAPEVETALQDIAQAVSPNARRRSVGQGRGLTTTERIAVERRAMVVAEEALRAAGFTDIEDVSRDESFDFSASRGGVFWCVEVKGTTSPTADAILMTANEVVLHRSKKGSTVLALVAGIDLVRTDAAVDAVGGTAELLAPWDCDLWAFEATVYRVRRPLG